MKNIINWFINLYALWIILAFAAGFVYPEWFAWFSGNWMTGAMAVVMLSMGLTLKVDDFKAIGKMPTAILLGAATQYGIMPFSAWTIARILHLDESLAVGLILVGCCPGGTASNLIAYIARANLALSIVMTSVSTILAVFLTPMLCQLLAGHYVPVDALGMFITILEVVLIPVALGITINYCFPIFVQKLGQTGPVISTWAIFFISGNIIARSTDAIAENVWQLTLAAALLHLSGFALGYTFARIFKYKIPEAKTVSLETGMQNGGMAAVLARTNFAGFPMAAVPSVFCSIMQTVIGGILGTIWRLTSNPLQKTTNNHV